MKIHFNRNLVDEKYDAKTNYDKALEIMSELREDKEDYTGWVNQPMNISETLVDDIISVATDVKDKCDMLVVMGIGGSYLGTAAILEALGGKKDGYPELVFAGNNISGTYLNDVVKKMDKANPYLCVVSKSGNTMETKIAFSVLKAALKNKYGADVASRIIAITDPKSGSLRAEANEEGYRTFEIPGNIGGRYSAFTPAILFPLAVAGVDIRKLISGAKDIAVDESFWKAEGVYYPLTRYALNQAGKDIEVFEYYEPSMRLVGEWCKQLFGESEGKQGLGLFPASLTLSTDLHSMGQFLQDGNQIFFETVINVVNGREDVVIPASAGTELAGKTLNEINHMAMKGVMAAHSKVNVPIIQIDVENCDEYCIGQLLYFFMMTAAVTGKLMGIDPFNQPGVEDYKAEIRKLLGQ